MATLTFHDLAKPGVAALSVYEPGRPIEEVARELGLGEPPIKLASNENALGPSPRALEAMRVAAAAMHLYPDGGAFHLREALAKSLDLCPEQILPGNGSNELLELLGRVFLDEAASIVVSDHAFIIYRLIAESFGCRVISTPMRGFCHDLEAMADAVASDTRLLYVGNPNNPTGTMVTAASVRRLMDRIPDHVIVCFDEAYIELVPESDRPDTLRYVREGRHAIVLRTFSKVYGLAGLRIGYAVAPERCIQLLNRVRQPFNVNAMALAAAQAALADEAHVRQTRDHVIAEMRVLERSLAGLGYDFVPSVANFLLVKVGQGRRVFEVLQRLGIIVRPMDGYGLGDYVRVTVGTCAENRAFLAALPQAVAGVGAAGAAESVPS